MKNNVFMVGSSLNEVGALTLEPPLEFVYHVHTKLYSSTALTNGEELRFGHNENMSEVIIRDPEIMHGPPVFKGTRVPLQNLFDYLEGGHSLDYFLEGFPTVSRALAIQALEKAKELLLSGRAEAGPNQASLLLQIAPD